MKTKIAEIVLGIATACLIYCGFNGEIVTGRVIDNYGNGRIIFSTNAETRKAVKDGYDYISYKYVSDAEKGKIIDTICINDLQGECWIRMDF